MVFLKPGLLYDRHNRALIAQALPFNMLSDAGYEASYFRSRVWSNAQDVEECDRLRRSIVRLIYRLSS